MRLLRSVPALALTAALVGGLTACTGGGSGSHDAAPAASSAAAKPSSASPSPTQDPATLLRTAAASLQQAGGAKFTMSGGVEDGSGVMVWKSPVGFSFVGSDGAEESQYRFVDGTVYLATSAKDRDSTFKGKHWLKYDAKSVTDKAAGADSAALVGVLFLSRNPVADLTTAVEKGTPTLVGPEAVKSVPATRFKATFTADDLVGALAGLTDDQKARTVADYKKNGTGSITVDFWLNAKGELIQLRETAGSGKPTVIGLTEYGTTTLEAPAASDCFNLADLLKG